MLILSFLGGFVPIMIRLFVVFVLFGKNKKNRKYLGTTIVKTRETIQNYGNNVVGTDAPRKLRSVISPSSWALSSTSAPWQGSAGGVNSFTGGRAWFCLFLFSPFLF